jgi:hypothetical protein
MADRDREAMQRDAEAEAALVPFLGAVRADEPAPPVALLNAILADAAAVSAERRQVTAPARAARSLPRLRAWLEPIGGWRGAAALGLCAALGFWVGLSGGVAIDGTTVWAGSTDGTDPVAAFFDLAAAEG